MTVTLRYQLGDWKGQISINVEPNEPQEAIVARARRALFRHYGGAPLGLYSESWTFLPSQSPSRETHSVPENERPEQARGLR